VAGRRRAARARPRPRARGLLVEELEGRLLALRGLDRLREQGRAGIAAPELGMGQDGAQLRDVGRHAGDVELGQRALGAVDRRFERAAEPDWQITLASRGSNCGGGASPR
jgi:hypothetical protein